MQLIFQITPKGDAQMDKVEQDGSGALPRPGAATLKGGRRAYLVAEA